MSHGHWTNFSITAVRSAIFGGMIEVAALWRKKDAPKKVTAGAKPVAVKAAKGAGVAPPPQTTKKPASISTAAAPKTTTTARPPSYQSIAKVAPRDSVASPVVGFEAETKHFLQSLVFRFSGKHSENT